MVAGRHIVTTQLQVFFTHAIKARWLRQRLLRCRRYVLLIVNLQDVHMRGQVDEAALRMGASYIRHAFLIHRHINTLH